jgi:hypothetical protein
MLNHLTVRHSVSCHGHAGPNMTAAEHALASFQSIWVYKGWLTLHMRMRADEVLRGE